MAVAFAAAVVTAAAVATTADAVAQSTTFVVPAKAEYRSVGNWHTAELFPAGGANFRPVHAQLVYDNFGISVPSANVRSLAVRRASSFPDANPTTQVDWTVRMANGQIDHVSATSTFAANLGAQNTTVFSGRMRLPSRAATPWPAQFENPVPFTAPFPYSKQAGQSLVVDLVVHGCTANRPWVVETSVVEYGSHVPELVQPTCRHSGGVANVDYETEPFAPIPGGPFHLTLTGMPVGSATMAGSRLMFGGVGAGGTFAGVPLPFELAAVGLPSYPGCRWTIDMLANAPMSYDPSGRLSVAFRMPNDPIMSERSFWTQALCVDLEQGTSELRLYPSVAVRWTVGFGKLPAATTILRTEDATPPAPTGVVRRGEAIVLQLGT